MTDIDGRMHRSTLPIGKMNPAVWEKQKILAAKSLPPPYVELITKTTQPFITLVTDIASPKASFFDGKLLLVGDALVPFRPHVACSTNQAALDALLLEKMLKGEIPLTEWERQALDYAELTRLRSITWGA
jgi:2-polyprenyl-6-methoxyphenol hydroxylase-like FAD-dependent oxidoreductase